MVRRPARDTPGTPVPRFALFILCFVLIAFMVQVSVNLFSVAQAGRTTPLVGMLCFAVIDVIQLSHSLPQMAAFRRRYGRWTLSAQALLTYLPILLFGEVWGAAGGFLSGSALLLLPAAWGRTAFTLVTLSIPAIAVAHHSNFQNTVYIAISTMLSGLVVYGLSRLAGLVVELHRAREKLARMAVAQERLRFARDLHDLLGYSLSAITLKSEVAIRLVPKHRGRAVDELTSILEISRQALSDVRAVASSYRDMSLSGEVAAAEAMLRTADIDVEVRLSDPPLSLDGQIDTVLATVLREAVTNMLRHSKVQHCLIATVREGSLVRLTIVNDGVTDEPETAAAATRKFSERSGSGLANLDSRVAAIGGRLTAGVRPDGRFQLVAEAPLEPAVPLRVAS
ncbi:histidine kinase [Kitasatospora sp. NBC_00070]|uniref:sensor histidine kinase n=1 Tax=Kitasatospora sp. NBC_00070 TaxID=2975962 RepID=UPI003246D763